MRFQIRRAIGCVGVCGRMRLIERIGCEGGHGIKDLCGDLFGNACGDGAVTDDVALLVLFTEDEGVSLVFHFLRFFL